MTSSEDILSQIEQALGKIEFSRKDRIDEIIVTKLIPDNNNGYKCEYNGKEYFLANSGFLKKLKNSIPEYKVEENYLNIFGFSNSFSGIPIIEDEELANKILMYLCKKIVENSRHSGYQSYKYFGLINPEKVYTTGN